MNPTRCLINSLGNHTVQICLTENSQVDLVTRYIKDGLRAGEPIFVISKLGLRKNLKLKMNALSFDGQPLQDPNQVRFFDAEFLLMHLKAGEGIEEAAFHEIVAAPMYKAQSGYKKVRALGEMFDILWKQGQDDMVRQLAGYCKNLTDTHESSILCTYSLDQLDSDSYDEALECICKYHSHLIPQEFDNSTESELNEITNAFGAAWARVVKKLAH